MPTAARSRVGTSMIASSGRFTSRKARDDARMDRAAGTEAVGAAAQDHGIAGLQAQRAGIGRHVRAAFEDHADHPERHAHALDGHAVRPRPASRSPGLPDRGCRGWSSIAAAMPSTRFAIQRQPVEEGGRDIVRPRLGHVLGIGGDDRGGVGAKCLGDCRERPVLLLRRSLAPAPAQPPSPACRCRASARQDRQSHQWLSAARSFGSLGLRPCLSTIICKLPSPERSAERARPMARCGPIWGCGVAEPCTLPNRIARSVGQ